MSFSRREFVPEPSLLPEGTAKAHARCRAVVIVPARNEEASLPATLDALATQEDLRGEPLDPAVFEIVLLLNNCTDSSAAVAHAWAAAHRDVVLHIAEKSIPPPHAHVGTARRLLMDTAWARLRGRSAHCGILSTDSDTVVAPDWIAQNLGAISRGADAVGGVIELLPGDLEQLPAGARTAYRRDREYQHWFAELEGLLDPQAGDPLPRHLEHFGASLACTPATYERAGGLPPVNPLEDMAFVDVLYRIDARLRHEPAVRVATSARFDGRAEVGLSWQLRMWQEASERGEPHTVPCAPWVQHRFRSLRFLRQLHRAGVRADLRSLQAAWRDRVREALEEERTTGEFLAHMDCDAWIAETYTGRAREAEITVVNRELRAAVGREHERLRQEAAGKPLPPKRKAPPTRVGAGPSGTGQIDVL